MRRKGYLCFVITTNSWQKMMLRFNVSSAFSLEDQQVLHPVSWPLCWDHYLKMLVTTESTKRTCDANTEEWAGTSYVVTERVSCKPRLQIQGNDFVAAEASNVVLADHKSSVTCPWGLPLHPESCKETSHRLSACLPNLVLTNYFFSILVSKWSHPLNYWGLWLQ